MNHLRWLCLIVFVFSLPSEGNCQDATTTQLGFIRHLMARGDHAEALFVVEQMLPSDSDNDSLYYLQGTILYRQKELESSALAFLRVGRHSELYAASRLWAAYQLAHIGSGGEAYNILQGLDAPEEGLVYGMRQFQLAGLSLLERDADGFARYSEGFSGSHQSYAMEEKTLLQLSQSVADYPKRSPLLAGAMSAIIPGLGKVYAGKPGEGIIGFLYMAAMGATTWELAAKRGFSSPATIISAGITGVFYIGNIWGSAVAVTRKQQEFNHEMDQRILFHMHIPLRNAFN